MNSYTFLVIISCQASFIAFLSETIYTIAPHAAPTCCTHIETEMSVQLYEHFPQALSWNRTEQPGMARNGLVECHINLRCSVKPSYITSSVERK